MRTRILIVLCACSCLAIAQDRQPTSPNIRARVGLVLVPVAVTDQNGRFLTGLTADSFHVSDDGIPQKIRVDPPDAVLAPVSLVIAIQSSAYAQAALGKIRKVGALLGPLILGQEGCAAVVTFDQDIRVLQDFTQDAGQIEATFSAIHPRAAQAGRLLDAVAESARMLSKRSPNERRVLLTISESRDRGSQSRLTSVLEQVQRAGVLVYSLSYSVHATPWTAHPGDDAPPDDSPNLLAAITEPLRLRMPNAAEALARATGGDHLSFVTLHKLETALTRTGEKLHNQYMLSFVPAETENHGFHKIEVTVSGQPGSTIRARPGYWAQR